MCVQPLVCNQRATVSLAATRGLPAAAARRPGRRGEAFEGDRSGPLMAAAPLLVSPAGACRAFRGFLCRHSLSLVVEGACRDGFAAGHTFSLLPASDADR